MDVPAVAAPLTRVERLTDLFYERFFANDLLSADDDTQLAAANLMAVLAFPGLFCLHFIPKYYVNLAHAPESVIAINVFGDRLLWLMFDGAVIALLATLSWDRLFPDRRDYSVIGVHPLPLGSVFEAQARALARFLGLFLLVVNAWSAAFFPLGAAPARSSILEGLVFAVGHWVSLALAGSFGALVIVALQGVLSNVLTPRALERVSAPIQNALAAGLIALVVLLPWLKGQTLEGVETVSGLAALDGLAAWNPAVWFAAVGEALAGRRLAVTGPLALTGAAAWVLAAAVAVGSYLLSYRRFLSRSLESVGGRRNEGAPRIRRRAVLLRRWIPGGLERGVFVFTLRTLFRDPKRRLEVGGYAAVGAALGLVQTLAAKTFDEPSIGLVAIPYVLLFLVAAGLRSTFEKPAELTANWVFRLNVHGGLERALGAVRKAIWAAGPLPILALSTAVWLALWGETVAGVHLAVFAAAAWLTIEGALAGFWKIPFTCSYVAPRAHVILVWGVSAACLFTYAGLWAGVEGWAAEHPLRLASAAAWTAAVGGAWIVLYGLRTAEEPGPAFSEEVGWSSRPLRLDG